MAIAIVSHITGASTDSNGFTSASLDTTGANFLVIALAEGNTSDTAISDSKSNTWTELTQQQSLGGKSVVIWYAKNTTVGAGHTFTVAGTTCYPAICVAAFSGVDTSAPFDVQNGATGAGFSLATGSITPGSDNELLISGFEWGTGDAGAATKDLAAFTLLDQVAPVGAISQGVALAYEIQTTATARNLTWSLTSGSDWLAAAIASFKSAAVTFVPEDDSRPLPVQWPDLSVTGIWT
jgi:hypothetical protein